MKDFTITKITWLIVLIVSILVWALVIIGIILLIKEVM